MALSNTQLAQLKTELLTDPIAYGYAAYIPVSLGGTAAVANWNGLAGEVNKIRTGADGKPAISVKRDDIQAEEIFHAINVADLATNPSNTQVQWLNACLTSGYPIRMINNDGSDTPVRTSMLALLKTGASATKTRLQNLETRFGSRAEELFGIHVAVTDVECEAAVRLP